MCMHNLVRYAANMADQMTPFAEWLRERAAAAGYDPEKRGSTAKLARASRIDVGQISRFLNGKGEPSAGNLPALADTLGVSIDEMARRIAGTYDILHVDGTGLTPEQAVRALGITDPADVQMVIGMVDLVRFRLEAQPKFTERSHTQRGVGGPPRPHEVKADEPEE